MRMEAQIEIDKLWTEKMKVRHEAARKIQGAWHRYLKRKMVEKYRKLMEKYIRLYKMQKQFKKYTKISKFANKLKMKYFEKKFNSAIIKIQKCWKGYRARKQYKKAKSIIIHVQANARRAIKKYPYQRTIVCYRIVNSIVDQAYEVYHKTLEEGAALTIQRIWRGYRVRKEHPEEVKHLQVLSEELSTRKAAKTIQRHTRGWIVRNVFAKFNSAASFIQATMKMFWKSNEFQAKRIASRIIQANVRSYLTRKNIIDERLKEYLQEEYLNLHKRRIAE